MRAIGTVLAVLCLAVLTALSVVAAAPNDPGCERDNSLSPMFGGASHPGWCPCDHYYCAPYQPCNREKDVLSRVREKTAAFSTFLAIVWTADLEKLLRSKGPITLVLPTNAAFEKMAPEDLKALMTDRERAREFVLSHVLQGRVTADSLGQTCLFFNIPAKNGLIHVVDSVTPPPLEVALK